MFHLNPLLDGSMQVMNTPFTLRMYDRALETYPELQKQIDRSFKSLYTAPELGRDIWHLCYFTRQILTQSPKIKLYGFNRHVVKSLLADPNFEAGVIENGSMGKLDISSWLTILILRNLNLDKEQQNFISQTQSQMTPDELRGLADQLDKNAGQQESDEDYLKMKHEAATKRREADEQEGQDPYESMPGLRNMLQNAVKAASQEVKEARETGDVFLGSGWGNDKSQMLNRPVDFMSKAIPLAKNKRLAKIAAMVGKLSLQANRMKEVKSPFGYDRIVGIKRAGSFEHMTDNEQVKLAHPLSKKLLMLEYASKRIVNYRYEGRKKVGLGPMICMMDTSGSMSTGEREEWAKGLAWVVISQAKQNERDSYLLSFDTGCTQYYYPGSHITETQKLEFCNQFRGGGTDLWQMLKHTMDTVKAHKMPKEADGLLLTDGEVDITAQQLKVWLKFKEDYNFRLFGILVATRDLYGAMSKVCDHFVTIADIKAADGALNMAFNIN